MAYYFLSQHELEDYLMGWPKIDPAYHKLDVLNLLPARIYNLFFIIYPAVPPGRPPAQTLLGNVLINDTVKNRFYRRLYYGWMGLLVCREKPRRQNRSAAKYPKNSTKLGKNKKCTLLGLKSTNRLKICNYIYARSCW